jgi:uncharacterized membrane protein
MPGMMTMLLAIHIAAGSVALLSMFVPMVTRKGGLIHRRAGWVFVVAMATVAATALVLSGARLLFDPTLQGRNAGLFLLLLTVLTASGVSAGVRVLRFKARAGAHRHWWDLGLPALLVVIGTGVGLYGLMRGSVLFAAFAGLSVVNGVSDVRYWLRRPSSQAHWWFEHMGSMLGSSIAATTAFLVNTADNFGIWILAAWLGPSIIGAPAIAIWTAYYRRRFAAPPSPESVPVPRPAFSPSSPAIAPRG